MRRRRRREGGSMRREGDSVSVILFTRLHWVIYKRIHWKLLVTRIHQLKQKSSCSSLVVTVSVCLQCYPNCT